MQEASAIGIALTLRRPLRIETIAPKTFGIDGTPTDCVNWRFRTSSSEARLDRLRHQQGWNLGDDVTYSGTVSGALEGALLGIPGDCRVDAELSSTQRRV
jgi:5'-nucleotidase